MTRSERMRAGRISAAVDELLRDPEARPEVMAEDAGLLTVARRLAQLPALLGPPEPILEQQVMRRLRTEGGRKRLPALRPGWAVIGLTVLLLLATLLTPPGQAAVASFLAVFHLGHTEVRITPVDRPATALATAAAQSTAVQHSLTLAEARAQVAFAIPQPTYLPPDYSLRRVTGYTYPDLPAWIPQPLFVELTYEDGQGHKLRLYVYPIVLGEGGSISRLNLEAAPIHNAQDVEVNGRPGVLLRLAGGRTGPTWQEVVWEQDNLILALSADTLSEAELLRVARSVE